MTLNIEGRGVGGQVGRRGVGMEARGPRGWSNLKEGTYIKIIILHLVLNISQVRAIKLL